MKTIEGLTYTDLDATLTGLGYVRNEKADRVIYRYPADRDALIVLPRLPLTENVRGIDLMIVRATVDGFGIMDKKAFDLHILQRAQPKTLTEAK